MNSLRGEPKLHVPRRSVLVGGLGAAAVTGLSACGGDNKGKSPISGTADDYAAGSAKLKVELGPEIKGVLYPEGYVGPVAREQEKFSDGSTTYRVVSRSFPNQNVDGNNAFSKHLEEVTGVKVKYEIVPKGDDGAPKINAMISSGDLPDAFMLGPEGWGGFTLSQAWIYGQQGTFLALDKLIDENAPELVNLFSQFPELRKSMTAPDGKLYMFPSINQCYHCRSASQRTWVHRPTAEKAGVDLSKVNTLDDFESMLKEFKAAGVIPMSGYMDIPPTSSVLEAAFLNIGIDQVRRKGDDIVFSPILDEYREMLIATNKFVKAGLIDPNGFTQNADQFKRLAMDAGGTKIGVATGHSQSVYADVEYNNPNARWLEFEPLKPVKGPDGKAYVAWNYTPGGVIGLILTSKARNPEELIRWADYQTGLVSTLTMRLGTFKKHWDWAKEGDKGIDDRQAIYGKTDVPHEAIDTWWEMGPYNLCMDVRHGEATDDKSSREPGLYRAGKLYEPFAAPEDEYFLPPFFTSEQASQIGELRVNIDNAYLQGRANMAIGKTDPTKDSDWKSYVDAIRGAGVDSYLTILKEADELRKKSQ